MRRKRRGMFFTLFLAPLDWVVLAILVCVELVGRVWRRVAPEHPPKFPLCQPECSLVMATWHGKDAVKQSLPALMRAVRLHGGNHEVIIVLDYESADGTEQYVRQFFPEVKIVVADHPMYFNGASRLGIARSTRDIVILINNDTIVDEGFLAPLIGPFRDPDIFGVASHVTESGEFGETGKTHVEFNGCDFNWAHERLAPSSPPYCTVPWLHRGAFALDRRKYHWLRGLDDLFDPFYFEDADLSYRAWKVGWRCLFSLNSRVTHKHILAMPSAADEFLSMIVRRNANIFFWKNIDDLPMLLRHFGNSGVRSLHRCNGDRRALGVELHAYFATLKRLSKIVRRKLRIARWIIRNDRETLRLAQSPVRPTGGALASSEDSARSIH